MSIVRAICGPNGSGKSTVYGRLVEIGRLGEYPWLNADDLLSYMKSHADLKVIDYGLCQTSASILNTWVEEHSLTTRLTTDGRTIGILARNHPTRFVWANDPLDAYDAAILTDVLRLAFLAEGLSFAFETVMSHTSKVELLAKAKGLGYHVDLIYVCTDNPTINVERVKRRAANGGHDVAEEKVRSRYERSLALLPDAIAVADTITLLDTSVDGRLIIAAQHSANVWMKKPSLPEWVESTLNRLS